MISHLLHKRCDMASSSAQHALSPQHHHRHDDGDGDDAAWNDPSFLSELRDAETHTLRRLSEQQAKRGRLQGPAESTPTTAPCSGMDSASQPSKPRHTGPEGEYVAALRGNHSETWQAMSAGLSGKNAGADRYGIGRFREKAHASGNLFPADPNLRGAGPVTGCFKCGKEGHWAKDCPMSGRLNNDGFQSFDGGVPVPEKNCRCGGGVCTVLTANTEKNPGRKFYRCPLKKEEGYCGFFEWCDSPFVGTSQGHAGVKELDLQCPCGAGPCVRLTAKTEKNMGRQFFLCPLNQGEGSCGFFKWCDEVGSDGKVKNTGHASNIADNTPLSGKSLSSRCCFKCGLDGHWLKDCPNKSSTFVGSRTDYSISGSGAMRGRGFGGSVTCFKCGQAGHCSNNCSSQQSNWGSDSVGGGGNTRNCYKCGGQGHWASSCIGQAGGKHGNSKSRGTFGRS